MLKKIGIAATLLWALTGLAYSGEFVKGPPVDEIVRKATHMALYQGEDAKGKVSMVITDSQGRQRKREFNMLRKDDGESDLDQKYFAFFHEPADVRKMVFMVHKHASAGKDDDRWLYMSSLDLVKRIAASDKRTSFVGSDFLYEDISGRNPREDVHELIKTTADSYVLKSTPKEPGNVEFAYYITCIDKKTFMPFRMEYFKKNDNPYRTIEVKKTERIEAEEKGGKASYLAATRTVATNLESGSKTEMTFSNIRFNIGLDDSIFTERYLRRPPRDAIR
jgi:outer membrane lipoprotein-sorting protein